MTSFVALVLQTARPHAADVQGGRHVAFAPIMERASWSSITYFAPIDRARPIRRVPSYETTARLVFREVVDVASTSSSSTVCGSAPWRPS